MTNEVTVGHDAEVFVRDIKTKEIIPVFGMIGGTKENPRPVKCGALQEDNVMAELNIDPAKTAEEFITNTKTVMNELRKTLKKHGAEPVITSMHAFDPFKLEKAMLDAFGRILPKEEQFGCEPDYCAWKLQINDPVDLSDGGLRFCGGHIHVGVPFHDDPLRLTKLVKHMDNMLYSGHHAMFKSSLRDAYYGKPGRHRPKSYGVEYRALDNRWLRSDYLMKWVFEATKACVIRAGAGNAGAGGMYDYAALEAYRTDINSMRDVYIRAAGLGNPLPQLYSEEI